MANPRQYGPLVMNRQARMQSLTRAVIAALISMMIIQSAEADNITLNTEATTGFTLDTPVEIIAADPAGAAVLNKDIPGLLSDPSYGIVKSLTLKNIARLSGGDLTDQMLARTEADLKDLRPKNKPGDQ